MRDPHASHPRECLWPEHQLIDDEQHMTPRRHPRKRCSARLSLARRKGQPKNKKASRLRPHRSQRAIIPTMGRPVSHGRLRHVTSCRPAGR